METKESGYSYRELHRWVEKHKGRPQKCEDCGRDGLTGRYIHWANISGKYPMDLNDYKRLCVRCHGVHDRKRNKNNRMGNITVKSENKTYGFLRCSEESVPKFKVLAAKLGYPTMVKFLDHLSEVPEKKLRELLK